MLSYLKGNMLTSPAQVQVNTVNTVGVMGKGIALQFKNKYPLMFQSYQDLCNQHLLEVGSLYLWKSAEKWILMFPTKKHWKNSSKMEYIESGLQKFTDVYEQMGIESIAFPKLGCGNGKLNWDSVRPLMEWYLKPLPISVYIYTDEYIKDRKPDLNTTLFSFGKSPNKSFYGMKKELQAVLTQHNDIFSSDKIKHVIWENETIVIQNGEKIELQEADLCNFWDYIRNVGIIDKHKIPEIYTPYADVMLELFCKLDYLEPVLIASNEQALKDGLGYQYVAEE